MAAIFAFTCSCCGKRHEGSPSFGYKAPIYYDQLSDEDKLAIGKLSDDLCEIEHPSGTDYFARAILEIPIHGVEQPFLWGVWVSLSQPSFDRYKSTWGNHDETDRYFGWLSNRLPFYPDTINLKTHARPKNGGERPILAIEPTDHLLSIHARQGISIEQAQHIAEIAMHGINRTP